MTATDSQRDVVDLLSADHREFDRIFTELEGLFGQTDPDVRAASGSWSTR